MFCQNCGAPLADDAIFCSKCGHRNADSQSRNSTSLVKAKCTNCGASLQIKARMNTAICPFCGETYFVDKPTNYVLPYGYAQTAVTVPIDKAANV